MKSEKDLDAALINTPTNTESATTRKGQSAGLNKPELSDDVIAAISGGASGNPPPPPTTSAGH